MKFMLNFKNEILKIRKLRYDTKRLILASGPEAEVIQLFYQSQTQTQES